MKLTLTLTVILIVHAIAEDDVKDVEKAEEKSAEGAEESPESYTVPVEVKDVVTESEARKAEADNTKEDLEGASADLPDLKSADDSTLSTSEHVTNRRSSDDTTLANDDKVSIKAAESEDAVEKQAAHEAATETEDIVKQGEEVEQKDDLTRSAADTIAQIEESSVAEEKSAIDDEIGTERAAEHLGDMAASVTEGLEDLMTNTRRMLNPLETILETKARGGERSSSDDFESLEKFDSPKPLTSNTFLQPLMSLPDPSNFFLKPALPLKPVNLGFHNRRTLAPLTNLFNRPPLPMNLLHSHENFFNPLTNRLPSTLQLPLTTIRPFFSNLNMPLPLPNVDELFRKPLDNSNSQEKYHPFQFNRRSQVTFGIPNYLGYNS